MGLFFPATRCRFSSGMFRIAQNGLSFSGRILGRLRMLLLLVWRI